MLQIAAAEDHAFGKRWCTAVDRQARCAEGRRVGRNEWPELVAQFHGTLFACDSGEPDLPTRVWELRPIGRAAMAEES